MKITEIKLTNWRNHWRTHITGLGRLNYVLGALGAGKSSILDAIQYAFCGSTRGTDDSGRGSDGLMCDIKGGPKASPAVTLLTDKGEIMRAVGQGPKSQAHFNIQTKLGLDTRFLKIMAAPMNLLRLERKKQGEVFFALAGNAVDAQAVEKALIDAGITNCGEVAQNVLTPAGRDHYLSYLKTRRPEVKREIAGKVYVPVEGGVKADEVKRRRLESELKAAEAKAEATQAANANRFRLIEQREHLLSNVEKMMAGMSATVLPPDVIAKKKAALTRYDDLAALLRSATESRTRLFASLDDVKRKIEQIKALGPSCGTCNQAIATEHLESQLGAAREIYDAIAIELRAVKERIDDITSEMTIIDVTAIVSSIRASENTAQSNLSIKAGVDANEKMIADVDARLAALPLPALVDDMSVRNLRTDIQALLDAEREGGRVLAINGERTRLEDELAELERIIEAIGPGGIITQMMTSGGIEDVVAIVKENAAKLGVGEVGITLDPWQITLNGRSIELASASEEWRVAAAFGFAFAKKAGASILCLDGAEIIRGDYRELFEDFVEKCGLEQVFVAASVDSLPALAVAEAGVSVYTVTADAKGVSQVKSVTTQAVAA